MTPGDMARVMESESISISIYGCTLFAPVSRFRTGIWVLRKVGFSGCNCVEKSDEMEMLSLFCKYAHQDGNTQASNRARKGTTQT